MPNSPSKDFLDFEDLCPELTRFHGNNPGLIRTYKEAFQRARAFRLDVVEPRGPEIERRALADPAYVDAETLSRACEYRLFSLGIPRTMGGQGLPVGALFLCCEELSAGCLGIANLINAHYLAIFSVLGTFNVKWLERLAEMVCEGERTGRPRLLSTAITEPGAGSDVEDEELVKRGDLCCEARPVKGGYLLNGRKVFTTNGSIAEAHVVVMPTDRMNPVETTHGFIVYTGTPGFRTGRIERKMGQIACPACELVFEDVFVPEDNRVSRDSIYKRSMELVFAATRGGVGVFGTGVARGAYERALHYCRTHELGGRPMIEHQWIQFKLTRMLKNVIAARNAYTEALQANEKYGLFRILGHPLLLKLDARVPAKLAKNRVFQKTLKSGMTTHLLRQWAGSITRPMQRTASRFNDDAKIIGADLGLENCYLAIDLMGGDGIRHDHGMEKLYRDAKLVQIYEGTNQINARDLYKCTVGTPATS